MTPEQQTLTNTITAMFATLYPFETEIVVTLNDDETITVETENVTFRAVIDSDDDEYLRFAVCDPDFDAEHPDDDPLDPISVRVRIA